MRTYTTEHTVYKFEELSEDAQQKAIENLRDINVDYEWWDYIFEDWQDKLNEVGFDDVKIVFSGFYSQGDGACFTCGSIDAAKFIKEHGLITTYKKLYKYLNEGTVSIYGGINAGGHYSHEMTMSIDLDFENYCDNDKQVDAMSDYLYDSTGKLSDTILEIARDYARDIYRELRKEYEYSTEDEQVIETIKINGYEFSEDGELD